MLFLVRINVIVRKEFDKGGKGVVHMAGNIDKLWDYIIRNYKRWRKNDINIMYLTHRSMENDISMFIDVSNPDELSKFLIKKIGPRDEVEGFWVFNFLEPKFFQIPSGIPHNLSRFTVTITAEPQKYANIYKTLTHYLPTKQVIPAYVAYTFHGFKSDLIMSILSDGQTTVNSFVEKYIKSLDGVNRTQITRISKTQRLVTSKEWIERAGSHFVPLKGKKIDDFKALEEDWIAGC
jgi:hypothetical protein